MQSSGLSPRTCLFFFIACSSDSANYDHLNSIIAHFRQHAYRHWNKMNRQLSRIRWSVFSFNILFFYLNNYRLGWAATKQHKLYPELLCLHMVSENLRVTLKFCQFSFKVHLEYTTFFPYTSCIIFLRCLCVTNCLREGCCIGLLVCFMHFFSFRCHICEATLCPLFNVLGNWRPSISANR